MLSTNSINFFKSFNSNELIKVWKKVEITREKHVMKFVTERKSSLSCDK